MHPFYSGEFVKPEGINIPLVMSLDEMGIKGSIEKDMLPAAVEAMTVDEKIYGYPTLLCGNVVTSIAIGHGPVSTEECPINQGSVPLTEYKNALKTCKKNLIDSGIDTFKTLVIGKMNDRGGWYLPYIYLDGYIDKHGKSSLMKAVKDLEVHRRVDKDLCKELNWFVDLCQTQGTNENKCRDGSVPTHGVQDSIVNRESVLMFSFSEKLAEVLKRCDHRCTPHVFLASVPLGDKNIFLQFTDGLVVSKERWIAHDKDKKDAIEQSVKFFTSSSFRYKLAYGFDLNKPQVRYLLMPNKGFYETPFPSAYDPIYRDAFTFLKEAVPAPALKNKSDIQTLLETECLQPDATRLSKRRVAPRPKNEL